MRRSDIGEAEEQTRSGQGFRQELLDASSICCGGGLAEGLGGVESETQAQILLSSPHETMGSVGLQSFSMGGEHGVDVSGRHAAHTGCELCAFHIAYA